MMKLFDSVGIEKVVTTSLLDGVPMGFNIDKIKYSFIENENIELDIYIPSLHLAIEYDGAHWHKNKSENDNYKNFIF